MSFTRRFTSPPTTAQETAIEGVNIVEITGPGNVLEVLEGIVIGVGECLTGPYAYSVGPVNFQPNSVDDFENQFGGYSPYLGVAAAGYGTVSTAPTQGGTNGNLFVAFRGKNFVQNMVARVDLRLVNANNALSTTNAAVITSTITGAAANVSYTIPAGTRLQATTQASLNVPSNTGGDGILWTAVPLGTLGNSITLVQNAPSGGASSAAISGTAPNITITISPKSGETNSGLITAIATSVAAYMTGVATGPSDIVKALTSTPMAGGTTNVVTPDNNVVVTTNGSGNGTMTTNIVNVSGLFPGQTGVSVAATGVTWTILDTQNLPLFGVATASNTSTATGLPVYTALTTSNTAFSNSTTIFPHGAAGTAPVDAYSAAYQVAIQACDTTQTPGSTADLIFSAFVDPDAAVNGTAAGQAKWGGGQMSSALLSHLNSFRSHGKGRVAVIMGQQGDSPTAAVSNTNTSLIHSPWLIYAYPWVLQSVPEASAVLTVPPNAWVACAMANVNPEDNPGQPGLPAIQAIQGFEAGVQPLIGDYINLKAFGIAAFYISPQSGVEIESGVTTDITNFTTIKNQRFRDFLEDTLAGFVVQFIKQLQTQERKNNLVGKVQSYLAGLLSQEDPSQQRIAAYNLDAVSGNTTNSIGIGVFRLKVNVQQLDDFRNIDLLMDVGESVQVTSQ